MVELFGIVIASFIGVLAGMLWPPLGWALFIFGVVCWSGLTVDGIVRQRHSDPAALLADNRHWKKEELPEEFRFIEHDTTIRQIRDKIGPHKHLRGDGEIRALEYHLPYGSAVLVFPELPVEDSSRVRAVKFYLDRKDIPLLP